MRRVVESVEILVCSFGNVRNLYLLRVREHHAHECSRALTASLRLKGRRFQDPRRDSAAA